MSEAVCGSQRSLLSPTRLWGISAVVALLTVEHPADLFDPLPIVGQSSESPSLQLSRPVNPF